MSLLGLIVLGVIFYFLFFGPHNKVKEKKGDKKDDKGGHK